MADDDRIMVMPFVTVKSHGGPHDDVSYICGFEMGYLDARLAALSALGGIPEPQVLHIENSKQIDLIAMQYNLRTLIQIEDEVWINVTFIACADPDEEDDEDAEDGE